MEGRRMFLIFVYMVIFVFSIYSIIQIRYFVSAGNTADKAAQFVFFFISTPMISQDMFILIKLSLFAFTGIASFIMMLSNYYLYANSPSFEKDIESKLGQDIKEIKNNSKKTRQG
jgi:hypothetical protein